MRLLHFLISILILIIQSTAISQLEPLGLQNESITSLSGYADENPSRKLILCASSQNDGVFIYDFSIPDSEWNSFGLESKNITSVNIHHWGAGPAEYNTVLAGVKPLQITQDSTLIFKRNYSTYQYYDWEPADNGMLKDSTYIVKSLKSFHYGGHDPSILPVLTVTASTVFRYIEGCNCEWEQSLFTHGWNALALHQTGLFGGMVWAGSKSSENIVTFTKSTDTGFTWISISLTGYDEDCSALGINPENNNVIYAALSGEIIKSTNDGDEWLPTNLNLSNTTINSIIINPLNTEQLYAGGTENQNNFALYRSNFGGDRWIRISYDTPLAGISEMVGDTVNGEFILYIGTLGNGVFRYSSPSTDIEDETSINPNYKFQLCQNYPNPFNPSTIISWQSPVGSWQSLKVYDVLGNEVVTLVDEELPAGNYEVEFDPGSGIRNLASGIYFYQLRVGDPSTGSGQGFIQTN